MIIASRIYSGAGRESRMRAGSMMMKGGSIFDLAPYFQVYSTILHPGVLNNLVSLPHE